MSLDDETQVRPRYWVGIAFILMGGLLLYVQPDGSSCWEEVLLILFGITIFSYHISKFLVPF